MTVEISDNDGDNDTDFRLNTRCFISLKTKRIGTATMEDPQWLDCDHHSMGETKQNKVCLTANQCYY